MPNSDKTGVSGCFHIHVEDGEIKNVFSHMTNFPKNCVIHLLPEQVFEVEEFQEDHHFDKDEVNVPYSGKIHNLGRLSVSINEDEKVVFKDLFDDNYFKNKSPKN